MDKLDLRRRRVRSAQQSLEYRLGKLLQDVCVYDEGPQMRRGVERRVRRRQYLEAIRYVLGWRWGTEEELRRGEGDHFGIQSEVAEGIARLALAEQAVMALLAAP